MFTHAQLLEKLAEFRQMPSETEWLEFKEAKHGFDSDKLGQYFSALSNEAHLKGHPSAWLVFGIADLPPRLIVGTQYRLGAAALEALKKEVAQQTNGVSFQEIYELALPEGRVILFQIPAAPAGIPTSWKGHYYGRAGQSLGSLSIQELDTIRYQAGVFDWSREICHEATLDDLDEEALRVAREKFQKKHAGSRFESDVGTWDTMTFLEHAKLTRFGQLTRTAILLLGKPQAYHLLSPHPAQITWKLDAEEQAYAHFGPPFLLSVEELFFKHVRNLRFRFQPRGRLIPIEMIKYDAKTVLEALNNCVAHQDYTQYSRIIVVEKVDRLILQSVGSFFDGTIEDYVLRDRMPSRYRNPFLAQAMVNLDMIDTMGAGLKRMFVAQQKRYFPLPEYDLQDPNVVRLVIYGKLLDENYSSTLIEDENLSLKTVMALDAIQKKVKIPHSEVHKLRRKGLVEGRYPSLFISSAIAEVINKKAAYIKNRAFDSDHYQKMILQFIDRYGFASRQDIEELILDKLSDVLNVNQKKIRVSNLLGSLRKQGLIQNQGTYSKPRWIRA